MLAVHYPQGLITWGALAVVFTQGTTRGLLSVVLHYRVGRILYYWLLSCFFGLAWFIGDCIFSIVVCTNYSNSFPVSLLCFVKKLILVLCTFFVVLGLVVKYHCFLIICISVHVYVYATYYHGLLYWWLSSGCQAKLNPLHPFIVVPDGMLHAAWWKGGDSSVVRSFFSTKAPWIFTLQIFITPYNTDTTLQLLHS